MAIKVKVSKKAMEEAANQEDSDFVEAPPGYYVAKVVALTNGVSKSSEKPQVTINYQITGVGKENAPCEDKDGNTVTYSRLWDYMQLEGESTEWKRAEIGTALGKKLGRAAAFDLEDKEGVPGSDIGKVVLVRVKGESYEGAYQAKVARVMPYDSEAVAGELDSSEESAEGDEGFDEESFDEDEIELTKENLMAMDKDELRSLADQFGYKIVAGTTKKAVIEGIIEAAEKAQVDDDDEPF